MKCSNNGMFATVAFGVAFCIAQSLGMCAKAGAPGAPENQRTTNQTQADDRSASDRAAVARFIERNLLGTTIETSVTLQEEADPTETVFSRKTTYANLRESESGFAIDAIAEIEQTDYDLNESTGERLGSGITRDRVVVSRFEFQERASVDGLVGFSRILSNSNADSMGHFRAATIRLSDGTLILNDRSVHTQDFFGPGEELKPGVSEIRTVFSVVNGKLRSSQTERNFYVDPETGEKTPVSDPVRLKGRQVTSGNLDDV